jgi:hypothetical protein
VEEDGEPVIDNSGVLGGAPMAECPIKRAQKVRTHGANSIFAFLGHSFAAFPLFLLLFPPFPWFVSSRPSFPI